MTLKLFTFCVDIGKHSQRDLKTSLNILLKSIKKYVKDYQVICYSNFINPEQYSEFNIEFREYSAHLVSILYRYSKNSLDMATFKKHTKTKPCFKGSCFQTVKACPHSELNSTVLSAVAGVKTHHQANEDAPITVTFFIKMSHVTCFYSLCCITSLVFFLLIDCNI